MTLLKTEDYREFDELSDELYESWKPVGAKERGLVEQIIVISWRLLRLLRVESGLFLGAPFRRKGPLPDDPDPIQLALLSLGPIGRQNLRALFSYIEGLREQPSEERHRQTAEALLRLQTPEEELVALAALIKDRPENRPDPTRRPKTGVLSDEERQKIREAEIDRVTEAFRDYESRFVTLMRYEALLERQRRSCEQQLERIQAAREGQYVPPPVAVDVNVGAK